MISGPAPSSSLTSRSGSPAGSPTGPQSGRGWEEKQSSGPPQVSPRGWRRCRSRSVPVSVGLVLIAGGLPPQLHVEVLARPGDDDDLRLGLRARRRRCLEVQVVTHEEPQRIGAHGVEENAGGRGSRIVIGRPVIGVGRAVHQALGRVGRRTLGRLHHLPAVLDGPAGWTVRIRRGRGVEHHHLADQHFNRVLRHRCVRALIRNPSARERPTHDRYGGIVRLDLQGPRDGARLRRPAFDRKPRSGSGSPGVAGGIRAGSVGTDSAGSSKAGSLSDVSATRTTVRGCSPHE